MFAESKLDSVVITLSHKYGAFMLCPFGSKAWEPMELTPTFMKFLMSKKLLYNS